METQSVELKAGEQALIGKMMVKNTSGTAVTLECTGQGAVLHQSEIVNSDATATFAMKVYYVVMNIYIEGDEGLAKWRDSFLTLMNLAIESNVPSMVEIMTEIGDALVLGNFRSALNACLKLIAREVELEQQAGMDVPVAAE
ncbi:MAG: hypothetical protein EAZ99_00710 [Alphaproteobacteria bacterium]|nr:flagellar biosynthesis repressor FlbT [Alphaproteobacteria bacterium]TAD91885.1 MAG: hypothetical protein EAZ99_00710 [Alphaproteobacteria bacterium]